MEALSGISWAKVDDPSPDCAEIPDKLYFRIGEVSDLVGVEPYVLRYWETEFPAVGPKKSGTGHRMYRRKEVELLLKIKYLLYDKKFTIDGARKACVAHSATKAAAPLSTLPSACST